MLGRGEGTVGSRVTCQSVDQTVWLPSAGTGVVLPMHGIAMAGEREEFGSVRLDWHDSRRTLVLPDQIRARVQLHWSALAEKGVRSPQETDVPYKLYKCYLPPRHLLAAARGRLAGLMGHW